MDNHSAAASPWRGVFLEGWHPYAWLAVVFLLYLPVLSYQLILLDDNIFLGERLAQLQDWANLPALFQSGSFLGSTHGDGYYRPLVIASLMLDAHLGARPLLACHLSNMVYHFLAASLFFAVLKRGGWQDRAFLLAMAFACHPLNAGAVGWINARTDTVLAVFVLAAFYCYQRCLDEDGWAWTAGHWLCLALGLLSKELAAVLPAACLGYAWLKGPRPRRARTHAVLAAGWLAVLAGWLLARQQVLGAGGGYSAAGMARSVLANLPAALVYWGKILLPAGLSTYPILQDSPLAYGGAAALLAGAGLWLSRSRDLKAALWGLLWFALFLLPSFIYPDASITPVFFEYRAYLPMMGALVLLAEARGVKAFDLSRPSHRLAAAALLAGLCAAARANSSHYRDGLSAWSRAVARSPHSAFARKQLGTVYFLSQDFSRAEAEYRQALALNPDEPLVHNNLGVVLMNTGRLEEAQAQYLAELRLNPDYDNALFNLGLINLRQGRTQEAVFLWQRTLSVNPDYDDARRSLIGFYMQAKDYPRAAEQLKELLRRGRSEPAPLVDALRPYL